MERIINSLLEIDAYKFSMGQAIYHLFSDYKTTWTERYPLPEPRPPARSSPWAESQALPSA